jgi:hypothetical protein
MEAGFLGESAQRSATRGQHAPRTPGGPFHLLHARKFSIAHGSAQKEHIFLRGGRPLNKTERRGVTKVNSFPKQVALMLQQTMVIHTPSNCFE